MLPRKGPGPGLEGIEALRGKGLFSVISSRGFFCFFTAQLHNNENAEFMAQKSKDAY